mmetsp:Transcript_1462/g.3003  ORF Transcript_1462/g.3003 Transcript_1462/m.3003 type:complete len:214 (-) Transcript_1462:342-983(-)
MHASQVARPRRLFGSHRDSETASAVVVRAAALFELRRDVSFSERVALAPRTVALKAVVVAQRTPSQLRSVCTPRIRVQQLSAGWNVGERNQLEKGPSVGFARAARRCFAIRPEKSPCWHRIKENVRQARVIEELEKAGETGKRDLGRRRPGDPVDVALVASQGVDQNRRSDAAGHRHRLQRSSGGLFNWLGCASITRNRAEPISVRVEAALLG